VSAVIHASLLSAAWTGRSHDRLGDAHPIEIAVNLPVPDRDETNALAVQPGSVTALHKRASAPTSAHPPTPRVRHHMVATDTADKQPVQGDAVVSEHVTEDADADRLQGPLLSQPATGIEASAPEVGPADQSPGVQFGEAPIYPVIAKRAGSQGTSRIKLFISASGIVLEAFLFQTSGSKVLDDAALASISRWHFRPAIRKGRAIQAWIIVPVVFSLTPYR